MAELQTDDPVAWVATGGAQTLGHGSLVMSGDGQGVVFLDDAGNAIGDSIVQTVAHNGACWTAVFFFPPLLGPDPSWAFFFPHFSLFSSFFPPHLQHTARPRRR